MTTHELRGSSEKSCRLLQSYNRRYSSGSSMRTKARISHVLRGRSECRREEEVPLRVALQRRGLLLKEKDAGCSFSALFFFFLEQMGYLRVVGFYREPWKGQPKNKEVYLQRTAEEALVSGSKLTGQIT